jgi:hypothetical protein
MPKTKISEYSATANSNTDVGGINIDEGCAPSGINDAIRTIMAQLKNFQTGTGGDTFNGPVNGTVGATTPASGAFTTLSATGNVTLGDASTDTLNVGNGGLIKDASGNLGVGVTPSAWNASYKALELVNGWAALSSNDGFGTAHLTSNCYATSTSAWAYKAAASYKATRYQMGIDGIHAWYISPSGTAGNAITFTQAMTLDASGRLGIGVTSPAVKLQLAVSGTGTTFDGVEASNGTATFRLGVTGSSYSYAGAGPNETWLYSAATTGLTLGPDGAGTIKFVNNGSERARIDSNGNLLVGTTTADLSCKFVASSATNGILGKCTADAASAPLVSWNTVTSGNNTFVSFGTEGTYTERGTISYNRGAGLIAYNVTSDYRAKDVYGPVVNSGALIDSVPVYMGKMKGATQERPMFIAHEVPTYAHTGEKDAVDADGNPVYQQMDASALIPVMWAEIQSLRQRVAQLESN